MENQLNELFENFTAQHPEWDVQITQALDENSEGKDYGTILEDFTEMLNHIVENIIDGKFEEKTVKEFFKNFKSGKKAWQYIKRAINKHRHFEPLRKLEKEDIYKAKSCVDNIFDFYIVRFNPYFDVETTGLLTAKAYNELARELDRITDICVEYNLHVTAISKRVFEEAKLSETMCNYIAEKINSEFEKLKLSYVVYKLKDN